MAKVDKPWPLWYTSCYESERMFVNKRGGVHIYKRRQREIPEHPVIADMERFGYLRERYAPHPAAPGAAIFLRRQRWPVPPAADEGGHQPAQRSKFCARMANREFWTPQREKTGGIGTERQV